MNPLHEATMDEIMAELERRCHCMVFMGFPKAQEPAPKELGACGTGSYATLVHMHGKLHERLGLITIMLREQEKLI